MAQMRYHGLCDRRCRSCIYSFEDIGTWDRTVWCGYIIHTKKLRPCPAGPGCTEYIPKPPKKKRRAKK